VDVVVGQTWGGCGRVRQNDRVPDLLVGYSSVGADEGKVQ